MDEHREARLQLEEVLKEVLNAVVSETEELLVAELARPRRVWVRKWINRRPIHGASYQLFTELAVEDTTEYYCALRMTEESFNILLNLVAPVIQKSDTFMRPALPVKVKLHAILYLLANGISLRVLQYLFRVPRSTTYNIISEVCDAIYNALRDYIKEVKAEEIKKLYKIINFYRGVCNLKKIYNLDIYFGDRGITVHRDYRRLGIAGELLKSRAKACKHYGIPMTGAWMTSFGTQKAAPKVGWETICEVSYDECVKIADVTFERTPPTCKFMVIGA